MRKTDFLQPNKKYLIPILILLLIPFYENGFEASGQEKDCLSSMTTRIDSSYVGPVLLDAYWTEQTASSLTSTVEIKKEVGPGDGPATLAAVLINRGTDDIYAVTGYLKVPQGFEPGGVSTTPEARAMFDQVTGEGFPYAAVANYNSVIPGGSAFTLYFDLNVTDTAKVGTYGASLVVKYYRPIDQRGCTSALLDAPFLLSGRVILDAVTKTQYLSPQTQNNLTISIENRGSADATGVVATILNLGESGSTGNRQSSDSVVLQSSKTDIVNLGSNSFNIGTIPAYGTKDIETNVYPSISAGGTVQNISIQLDYGNAYGYRKTTVMSTGLVILPNPVNLDLGISYEDQNSSQIITAGKVEDLKFAVSNNGKSPLSNIVIALSPESDSLKILGNSKWTIPELQSGAKTELSTNIFAAKSMVGTPTSFLVTTDYTSETESKTDSFNLGLVVQPDSVGPAVGISYDENSSQIITAGKVEDLSFTVTNFGKSTLSNIVISLSPESEALKILGNSKWTIPQLEPNRSTNLATKVFAAKSMIGTPTSFSVTADYVLQGESRTDILNLGSYVSGDIKLVIYDIALSNIGDAPTISGNLLNQGSSTGMFASIELMPSTKMPNSGQAQLGPAGDKNFVSSRNNNSTTNFASSPQYIGDLTADSSIPFSIPIKSDGRLSPGTYSVSFKVAYADDLKNFQEITLDGQVTVGSQSSVTSDRSGSFLVGAQGPGTQQGFNRGSQPIFLPIILIVIGAAVTGFFVYRRLSRRKKEDHKKKLDDNDIEKLLFDSESTTEKK